MARSLKSSLVYVNPRTAHPELTLTGPVIHHLLQDDPTLSFEFYDAEVECPPAQGIEALSEGPFYQWYLWDYLQKIPPAQTATNAIDNVLDIIAEEGPFDGVVGFSQGAAITASVLAHYSKKNPLEPQTNLFKFAMFICGSKPFTYDGMNRIDQCGKPVVQIPTAHVVGKKDQWDCQARISIPDRSIHGPDQGLRVARHLNDVATWFIDKYCHNAS
uniref:Serine hydrolase domain-containing protein n=1 Tax=Fusarium oxysporum (strain Fo5176) TaxID=660025 RepID=A0A0D2XFP9_FUSOF